MHPFTNCSMGSSPILSGSGVCVTISAIFEAVHRKKINVGNICPGYEIVFDGGFNFASCLNFS